MNFSPRFTFINSSPPPPPPPPLQKTYIVKFKPLGLKSGEGGGGLNLWKYNI